MYCYRHRSLNYRFISVMFWAFPYLLWQAFGNLSGFFIGVVLAVALTVMFNNLFHRSNQKNTTLSAGQQALHAIEQPQLQYTEEYRPYQSGYRAEAEPYREEQSLYHPEQLQPLYEEMQISYPQEIPPIENK